MYHVQLRRIRNVLFCTDQIPSSADTVHTCPNPRDDALKITCFQILFQRVVNICSTNRINSPANCHIMSRPHHIFNALIRTHHITSRKKIHRLKKAASQHEVEFVLIRSGGCPGMMYVESNSEAGVTGWVSAVQALRYEDYHCVAKPSASKITGSALPSGFNEVTSVSEFAAEMQKRGLGPWWRAAIGYGNHENLNNDGVS